MQVGLVKTPSGADRIGQECLRERAALVRVPLGAGGIDQDSVSIGRDWSDFP